MIETILIPVDGSPGAREALRFGSDLALHYNARVIILHVLLHQNFAEALHGMSDVERTTGGGLEALGEAIGALPLEKLRAARRDGEPPREVLEFVAARIVENAAETVRANGVPHVTTVVEDGDPVKRILECAEHNNADVIVMGARGLSDIEELLIGSVSHKVAHLASRTCIIVR